MVGFAGVSLTETSTALSPLLQPLPSVIVAVYEPFCVIVIEGVVAPVLHSTVPGSAIESFDEPHSFRTLITGVGGIGLGAAVTTPALLVQPLSVWVTVYWPGWFTWIDGEVSPVLHKSEPVATVESVETLQLSVTEITGVAME